MINSWFLKNLTFVIKFSIVKKNPIKYENLNNSECLKITVSTFWDCRTISLENHVFVVIHHKEKSFTTRCAIFRRCIRNLSARVENKGEKKEKKNQECQQRNAKELFSDE